MHLHTFVDRERKRSKNGDEGVVLVVIQITGDPTTERMAPLHSTHVRLGRRLLLLDPARGKERLRKMAPAAARRRGGGGAAVLRQGFAKLMRRRRGIGGEGCWGTLQKTKKIPMFSPRSIYEFI